MKCIDFDRHFAEYTARWVNENAGKYSNEDEMERQFIDVYRQWLRTPADWLGKTAPEDYFAKHSDAKLLVQWMRDYFSQGVAVPDLLLERIAELDDAPVELMALLSKPTRDEDEAKLCAIGLMAEMDSSEAFDLYIGWIARGDKSDDLAERAADAMMQGAAPFRDKLLSAYDGATKAGKLRLLDILAYINDDDRIFSLFLKHFNEGENRALFASYLQKYGDDRALPDLKAALMDPKTGYLDYIEIKNVIEFFGETIDIERDFSGDSDYEALKNI
ncbi:MAG: hypothetical protein ACOX8S_11625 [Christensenellales bacterium]|jgi:hypothetical protein